jgi:small redox-active disulfide protein 2
MNIKVLGPGCRNCVLLEQRTREALEDLGRAATIDKVTDFATIAGYGVMATPALVVDGRVVVSGRVPSARQIAELLGAASAVPSV